MGNQQYEKYINSKNYISVSFQTEKKMVTRFAVKLLCFIDKRWYEVIRYDSGHGTPHKDILLPDGSVERKVWYRYLDNNEALDYALDEINEQYEYFRWRFEKWLRKKDLQ